MRAHTACVTCSKQGRIIQSLARSTAQSQRGIASFPVQGLHLCQVMATPTRLPCRTRWLINICLASVSQRLHLHRQRPMQALLCTHGSVSHRVRPISAVIDFHRQTMLSSTQCSSTHCVCSAGGEHAGAASRHRQRCSANVQGVVTWNGRACSPPFRIDQAVLGRATMALPGGGHPVRLSHMRSQAGTPAL